MKTGKRRKVQEAERIKNADLFWRITDTLMIRRANEDEMVAEAIQLPPFTEREVVVEPSREQVDVIRWVEGKFLQLYRQQLERERRGDSFDLGSFSALMWAARRAATVPSCFKRDFPEEPWPKFSTWPKMEAIEKVAATCLQEGRKLVVFTGLNPAAEELVKRLAQYGAAPIPLTHMTPPSKRTKILRAFRMEDNPRIVVMGLLCGNVGLTLTSPKYPIDVLVADLDWSPSQIAQAIKRVYRPSQKYPVSAYTVLTDRSMDMDMLDLVYRKSKGIAQALDKVDPDDVEKRAPLSQREMLDELARRIEERQAREAVEKVQALLDQNKPIEAFPILKVVLNLQMVPWDVWEELHRLARKSLEQAMFAHPEQREKYLASMKSLDKMAAQRKPLEQAELMKAA
jgi:SNF2 family DNA or RNA helicase